MQMSWHCAQYLLLRMQRKPAETDLEENVQTAFDENRRVYGQRKLKHALARSGKFVVDRCQ